MDWMHKMKALPLGYSVVIYNRRRYGVTRTDFNAVRSTKIFAEELGGNHYISLNFYHTQSGYLLKPCEMPEKDVIHFLQSNIPET